MTKLLTELHRLANPESRLILGIIVVEDVFLALYLAMLQPVLGEGRRHRSTHSVSSRSRSRSCSRWPRSRAGARRSSAG